MMREERKSWQAILSVLAIIALSFEESFESLWSGTSIGTKMWSLCNIISACTQWAMPTMVALIGSIFLTPERKLKTRYLWQHHIPWAIVSCAIWWVLSAIIWMKSNHPQDLDMVTFRECMAEVLETPASIGFCQMLVTFFLLYPLLHAIGQKKQLLQYGIILIFCLSLVESVFRYIPYLSAIALFADQLNWGYYRAWAFYLLCGVWLAKYELNWKTSLFIYSLGIVSSAAMIASTSMATSFQPGFANEFIGYRSPLTGIQTLSICLFVRRMFSNAYYPTLTKITKNLWHCVPVVFIVSIFTERLTELFITSGLGDAICGAILNAIAAFMLVQAIGVLPGFKVLVGNYSRKGENVA